MVDGGVCVPVINLIIRIYLQAVNESFLMSYFRLFAASYQLYNEYIHGILDNQSFIDFLLKPYADKLEQQTFDYATFKEEQYDKLAEHVRKHINMPLLYKILERND